jgi:uncharacterized protein
VPRSCSSIKRRLAGILAALAAALPLGVGGCDDAGLVDDRAEVLGEAERQRLSEHHEYLLLDHDIDYRVVTAGDVGDINRFAVEQFSAEPVGSRSAAGRGLLLVIDPVSDQVRLEVGYALEGVFPDAFVAYVEHRQMLPFFREGRVADGILATTELIINRVQRAKARAGYDGEAWLAGTGGGGATMTAEIGAGRASTPSHNTVGVLPGATPLDTLAAYFAAMRARNGDPTLSIYTPETREVLARWTMTPAQMDNLVSTYRGCSPEVRYGSDGVHAVIRYAPGERACAPWFVQRGDAGWQLDLSVMQRAIRFGRNNAWRFEGGPPRDYGFAFEDWRFDGHGFPVDR